MQDENFYEEKSKLLCEPFAKTFNEDLSDLSEANKAEIGFYALANLTALLAIHFQPSNRQNVINAFVDVINEKIELAERNIPVVMANRAIEKAMKQ